MTRLQSTAPSTLQKVWKDFLEPIVFAVVITQFVATLVGVDGVSMMPNLRDRERVFVPKYETWLHKAGVGDFSRGDIVIFKPPREAAAKIGNLNKNFFGLWNYRPFLIKRVIGLPGDKIRVEGGEVFEDVWRAAARAYDGSVERRLAVARLDQPVSRPAIPYLNEPWYC